MKMLPTVTQGVPATKAFFQISKVQKPQITNSAEGVPGVPGATGGGAQALPKEIDLQAFFAAWGTNNEQFDVTKDGTVDAQDLSVFLGGVTEQAANQATPDQVLGSWGQQNGSGDVNGDGNVDGFDLAITLGQIASSEPKNTDLVDGVQKTWGTANATYDLNSDGTVDASDLAVALGQSSNSAQLSAAESSAANNTANATSPPATQDAPQATAQASEAAAKITEAVMQSKDKNGDGALAANELQSAKSYLAGADLDRDRAISREELQVRLTSMLSTANATSDKDLNAVASKWANALLRTDSAALKARNAYTSGPSSLANQLYGKLAANGFAKSPPSNINKLVQGLGINDAHRASVMRGLATRYPNGSGLSAQV